MQSFSVKFYFTSCALEYLCCNLRNSTNVIFSELFEYFSKYFEKIRSKEKILQTLNNLELFNRDDSLEKEIEKVNTVLINILKSCFSFHRLPSKIIVYYYLIDIPFHYSVFLSKNPAKILIVTNKKNFVKNLFVHELLHVCYSLNFTSVKLPIEVLEAIFEWFAPYGKLCIKLGFSSFNDLETRKKQIKELYTYKAYILAPYFFKFKFLENYNFESNVWEYIYFNLNDKEIRDEIKKIINLVRGSGFEPEPSAWEADVLPG